jgi:hypothetical protein
MCGSAACSEVLAAYAAFTRDTEGGVILGRSVQRPRDYRRTAVSGQRGLVFQEGAEAWPSAAAWVLVKRAIAGSRRSPSR